MMYMRKCKCSNHFFFSGKGDDGRHRESHAVEDDGDDADDRRGRRHAQDVGVHAHGEANAEVRNL